MTPADSNKKLDLDLSLTSRTRIPLPPQLGGCIPTGPVEHSDKPENILKEADRLTSTARNADYGTPLDNFTQTALLINAAFGTNFTAEDIGLILILVKVSRHRNRAKHDNLVDIAGYARTIQMVEEERKARAILKTGG